MKIKTHKGKLNMKIYLIRHGQTTGDIEDRFGGDYDDHLTKLGKTQAKELAQKLKPYQIEKIYHSTRIRAIETASIVNAITSIPLKAEKDLRERNAYGILTGELKKDAKEKYPELIEQLKNPKATIQGAVPYDKFKQRVLNIFSKLAGFDSDVIAIITHGGVISCFLREIIGKERKTLNDCVIIELEANGGEFSIIRSEGLEFKG